MGRFEGKVALLTGAASGIGRACATRFAAEGASIYGADIDEEGLAETAERVARTGGKMEAGRFDLSRPADCREAVETAVAAFGGLHVLGNIAGMNRFHIFSEMREEDWHRMLAINLSAPAFLSQAAIPHLLGNRGCIVNVASVAGLIGQAYTVAYCVTKGGVIQLTRALAAEYAKTDLRVNAVAPAGVDTPMSRQLEFPEAMDWTLAKRYVGHRGMASADEVAGAIAYLASDDARFVHGAVLSMDGGISAS
jgi:meso-butanediol dehydrogenase/(S,S)-butanediol dehydrogenase/diacetyl reductase